MYYSPWVVLDSVTSTNYSLLADNGEFYIDVATIPSVANPNIQDVITGLYYTVSVVNGIITLTASASTVNDTVYLYDYTLTCWYNIQISNGIFTLVLSGPQPLPTVPPIGATGSGVKTPISKIQAIYFRTYYNVDGRKAFEVSRIYPIRGRKSIRHLYHTEICAIKRIPTHRNILTFANRGLRLNSRIDIASKSKNRFNSQTKVCGIKQKTHSASMTFTGTKRINRTIPYYVTANKRFVYDDNATVFGKRDIRPILKACGINVDLSIKG